MDALHIPMKGSMGNVSGYMVTLNLNVFNNISKNNSY